MSRGGLRSFRSERLRQLLAVRRVNQTQLSERIDVSKATVSKWLNGKQLPDSSTVRRLAMVLEVRPEWFLTPHNASMSGTLFRSNASVQKAARSLLYGRMEWAEELVGTLEEFVDFPPLNLPIRKFTHPDQVTQEDIEEVAAECRSRWRLGNGPIQDLCLAAEGAGIIVIREKTKTPRIEGLSGWSANLKRPFIYLTADKDNAYRSRFDLAHEIAHLCLHSYIPKDVADAHWKIMEKQAHAGGNALTLPAASIAREASLFPTWDELLMLKKRWKISASAILMRLVALGFIGEDRKREMFRRRSVRWGSTAEPGDHDIPAERPRLLRRSIELLINEGIMPLEGILQHTGLSAADMESIAGLPEGFFTPYAEDDKIVNLATLKRSHPHASPTPSKEETDNVIPFPHRGNSGTQS